MYDKVKVPSTSMCTRSSQIPSVFDDKIYFMIYRYGMLKFPFFFFSTEI